MARLRGASLPLTHGLRSCIVSEALRVGCLCALATRAAALLRGPSCAARKT